MIAVYGLFAGAGWLWCALRGCPDPFVHPSPWLRLSFPANVCIASLLGVLVAGIGILSTRWLVFGTRWARELHQDLKAVLGSISKNEMIILSAASSIGEEFFFRAAIQAEMGVILTSILFGSIHVGLSWRWPVWAMLMGGVFGLLFVASGQLIAPMIAHFAINYTNMHFIRTHNPTDRTVVGACTTQHGKTREC